MCRHASLHEPRGLPGDQQIRCQGESFPYISRSTACQLILKGILIQGFLTIELEWFLAQNAVHNSCVFGILLQYDTSPYCDERAYITIYCIRGIMMTQTDDWEASNDVNLLFNTHVNLQSAFMLAASRCLELWRNPVHSAAGAVPLRRQ